MTEQPDSRDETATAQSSDRSQQTLFEQLDGPHKRGDASEAVLKAAFATRGITVLTPDTDNEPYDFAIDIGGQFYRLQAKTAYESTREGAVTFDTQSTRVKSDGYERGSYDGVIEFFAVYNPILDESYLVSIDDAPGAKMTIRYETSVNGQDSRINWRDEFLLDVVLDEMA